MARAPVMRFLIHFASSKEVSLDFLRERDICLYSVTEYKQKAKSTVFQLISFLVNDYRSLWSDSSPVSLLCYYFRQSNIFYSFLCVVTSTLVIYFNFRQGNLAVAIMIIFWENVRESSWCVPGFLEHSGYLIKNKPQTTLCFRIFKNYVTPTPPVHPSVKHLGMVKRASSH